MAAAPQLSSDEQTYVPRPDESAEITDFFAALKRRGPSDAVAMMIDGQQLSMPRSIEAALTRVAQAMAEKRAVVVMPVDQTLTTQEAATILGVSRPTIVRLLDSGAIEGGIKPNNKHRRVPLRSVLAYQTAMRSKQRSALRELNELDSDMGLFDADPERLLAIERKSRGKA